MSANVHGIIAVTDRAHCQCQVAIFIDRVALAKQGDNVLGSVRPSVCQFVCALLSEPFDL